MRVLLCFLYFFLILSCSCIAKQDPLPPLVFPNKDLEEIIMYGVYYPENPNYAEELKEEYYSRGRIKEYEAFIKDHPDLLNRGKERFRLNLQSIYCYNKTKEEDKPPIDKKFIARLYNKNGEVLAKTFLRLRHFSKTPLTYSSFNIYLPYHKKASYINISILKEKKEINLAKGIEVETQYNLKNKSRRDTPINKGESDYLYNEERKCHIFNGGHNFKEIG